MNVEDLFGELKKLQGYAGGGNVGVLVDGYPIVDGRIRGGVIEFLTDYPEIRSSLKAAKEELADAEQDAEDARENAEEDAREAAIDIINDAISALEAAKRKL